MSFFIRLTCCIARLSPMLACAGLLGADPPSQPKLVPRPVPGMPVTPVKVIASVIQPAPTAPSPMAVSQPSSGAAVNPDKVRILTIHRGAVSSSASAPLPPSYAGTAATTSSVLIAPPLVDPSQFKVLSQAEAARLIEQRAQSGQQ